MTTEAPHGFTKEDRIDLYTDRGDLTDIPVLEVLSPQTFVVACDHSPAQVFVYGKYVPDFRTIDYEKVAMLNVSATQELVRRVEALEALVVRLLEERAAKP